MIIKYTNLPRTDEFNLSGFLPLAQRISERHFETMRLDPNSFLFPGVIGLPGIPGATGAPGPNGLPGPNGIAGPNGAPGAGGATGAAGPQGDRGAAGTSGPADSHSNLTDGAGISVDFNVDSFQTLTITTTGTRTFSTANRAAAQWKIIRLLMSTSVITFSFPASWIWLSAIPTTIDTNFLGGIIGILSLTCFGPADSDIVAIWSEVAAPV